MVENEQSNGTGVYYGRSVSRQQKGNSQALRQTGQIGGKDRRGVGRLRGNKNVCPTQHHCPNSLVWASAQVLPLSSDLQSDLLQSPFTKTPEGSLLHPYLTVSSSCL